MGKERRGEPEAERVATITWGEFKAAVDAELARTGMKGTVSLGFIRWSAVAFRLGSKRPVEVFVESYEQQSCIGVINGPA